MVFTTGSTGQPKAALLTHRSITAQNFGLGEGFGFEGQRVLVNLPPSHVGGQAELLMTTLFCGALAVTLETFDPGLSLTAIETHGVTLLGQIPAMFQMEWRHSDYPRRDLSSLQTVVYGGQAVPRPFLERLRAMGPRIATGLGLTEASGFCTYTPLTEDPEALSGLGNALPLYPMSIRRPMDAGGAAGGELPDGEIGCVCFRGPQTFAGYVNDPEATAKAVSTDGYLYTGDMGFRDGQGPPALGAGALDDQVRGLPGLPRGCGSPLLRADGPGGRLWRRGGGASRVDGGSGGLRGEGARGRAHRRGTAPACPEAHRLHAAAPLRHRRARPAPPEPGGQGGHGPAEGLGRPGGPGSEGPGPLAVGRGGGPEAGAYGKKGINTRDTTAKNVKGHQEGQAQLSWVPRAFSIPSISCICVYKSF